MSPAPIDVPGSPLLRVAFTLLTLFVAALFIVGVYWRRATIATCLTIFWIAGTGLAAARGALHFTPPPTMLILFLVIVAGGIGLATSPLGRQLAVALPLAALVGYQGFRVIVELLMHRAYVEGLMPVQMSYSGRNYDIVTGITALGLGSWLVAGTLPRWLVLAWNTLGLALLANIVTVALLSAPTPMRVFMNEPANVWITHAPWVWLPAVLVFAALAGHVLVYRRFWAHDGERLTAA
jgi:hypothetical protein